MARALADFLLGKQTPPRIPFLWRHPLLPYAAAISVAAPLDLAGKAPLLPGATPMLLNNQLQILDPTRWTGPADLSAKATAGWDKDSLYVEVDVTDDVVISSDKQPAWGYDGIEFFLDTRPADKRTVAAGPGYFQMLVPTLKADGPTSVYCGNMDTFDPVMVEAAYRRTIGGYNIRFAMPWSALKYTPEAGKDIGFDFAINDRDDEKLDRYKALWRGAGDDYTNAGALGTLTLAPAAPVLNNTGDNKVLPHP